MDLQTHTVSCHKSVFLDFERIDIWVCSIDKINYLNSPSNRRGNNELEEGEDDLNQEEDAEGSEEDANAEMNDAEEQDEGEKEASNQEEE